MRIHDKYGNDTSSWTEDVVAVVGRMVALLSEEDIENIPEVCIAFILLASEALNTRLHFKIF